MLEKLSFAKVPEERFAEYAYVLTCLKYPASVVDGKWNQKVDDLSDRKLTEFRNEITRRLTNEGNSETLSHALSVLDETAELASRIKYQEYLQGLLTLEQLSLLELVGLHSQSRCGKMKCAAAENWRYSSEHFNSAS